MNHPIPHPPVATRTEWLAQRRQLLEREKEVTHERDRVAAERRRLPMVRLEERYTFEAANGERRLDELFEGRAQLIVYHFMFDPGWETGCPGCTGYVDALGDLSLLDERNTRFVFISRAPFSKLEAYRRQRGWHWPWFSSFGTRFNHDFHVTLDPAMQPAEYNYRLVDDTGEAHGLSVFFSPRRGCLSHLLELRPWGGEPDRLIQSARCDTVWPTGGLGGFADGLATAADLRVNGGRDGLVADFPGDAHRSGLTLSARG